MQYTRFVCDIGGLTHLYVNVVKVKSKCGKWHFQLCEKCARGYR